MSDASDPKHANSFFQQPAPPAWLLREDQVERILDTLPDKMHKAFIVRHMMAAERAAYFRGVEEGRKADAEALAAEIKKQSPALYERMQKAQQLVEQGMTVEEAIAKTHEKEV